MTGLPFILDGLSANDLFLGAANAVLLHGEPVSPRGLPTREVLGAHLCLRDPRRRFVDIPPGRVLNPAFAVAEAMWILSGSDDPWIFQYNRALRRYADHGRLQGAYGPRMRRWQGAVDQLDLVRRLLLEDPDSRQGVIQLFDPGRDCRLYRDVPCTLSYRFFLRRGRLHMHTTMRSQDVWLGLPYDLFTATMLHELMAQWVGAELGHYHHHVDSLHLYDHDVAAARAAVVHSQSSRPMEPIELAWDALPSTVAGVLRNDLPASASATWWTFAVVMASYRLWTAADHAKARQLARALGGDLGRALERWYARLSASSSAVMSGNGPA